MKRLSLLFILIIVCNGCAHDLQTRIIPTLTPDWRNKVGMGHDTQVGVIYSTTSSIELNYDIGHLAGDYANHSGWELDWKRRYAYSDTVFTATYAKDGTLYVTFIEPNEYEDQFANYYGKVSENDVPLVLELLARHRQELHQDLKRKEFTPEIIKHTKNSLQTLQKQIEETTDPDYKARLEDILIQTQAVLDQHERNQVDP